nr:hypothetical protein [Tanacetum cinerariifolium]
MFLITRSIRSPMPLATTRHPPPPSPLWQPLSLPSSSPHHSLHPTTSTNYTITPSPPSSPHRHHHDPTAAVNTHEGALGFRTAPMKLFGTQWRKLRVLKHPLSSLNESRIIINESYTFGPSDSGHPPTPPRHPRPPSQLRPTIIVVSTPSHHLYHCCGSSNQPPKPPPSRPTHHDATTTAVTSTPPSPPSPSRHHHDSHHPHHTIIPTPHHRSLHHHAALVTTAD